MRPSPQVSQNRITPQLAATFTFENILDELRRCIDERDLQELIQAYVRLIGYDCFLAVFQYPLRHNFVLHTYTNDWVATYNRKNYITVDPIVPRAKRAYTVFDWSELPFNPESLAMYQDAMSNGIFGGFSIPSRGPDSSFVLLNIATSKPQMLGGMRLYDIATKGQYFGLRVLDAGSRLLERMGTGECIIDSEISARQRECLVLLTQGYSAKEIAREMDVSAARVTDIVETLQKKFGVDSRAQVLARAGILNLIGNDYLPKLIGGLTSPAVGLSEVLASSRG